MTPKLYAVEQSINIRKICQCLQLVIEIIIQPDISFFKSNTLPFRGFKIRVMEFTRQARHVCNNDHRLELVVVNGRYLEFHEVIVSLTAPERYLAATYLSRHSHLPSTVRACPLPTYDTRNPLAGNRVPEASCRDFR